MTSDERDDGVGVDTETEPRHAEGLCDLGACENLANWAYEDSEGDVYVEVCEEHAGSLESQFDSDYERVDHDSPYRELSDRRGHGCGGDLLVY
ncbi:MAG: hypothetical protein SV760_03225, partial [Halobacteria archaeon]|nr:hypothetical protein [Halobacteria archaeon]